MIMIERRIELGLSIDKLSRLSGVPRFRCSQLEAGVESLSHIPFYQSAALAKVLEVPLDIWYDTICSTEYTKWKRGMKIYGKSYDKYST